MDVSTKFVWLSRTISTSGLSPISFFTLGTSFLISSLFELFMLLIDKRREGFEVEVPDKSFEFSFSVELLRSEGILPPLSLNDFVRTLLLFYNIQ